MKRIFILPPQKKPPRRKHQARKHVEQIINLEGCPGGQRVFLHEGGPGEKPIHGLDRRKKHLRKD